MLKKIFGGVWENIKEEKGAFFSSIVSFIMIFTLINIFIFGVLNADLYRSREEESNQVILYLKDMTSEEKENLQLDLLNLEGVSSLRYVSKDVALKALEKDLNVDLSSEANPLEDAFFVYLTRNVNVDELNTKLLDMDKFTEIDLRSKVINQTVEFSNSLDSFIQKATIFFVIFAIIIIYNISVLSIKARKREIHNGLLKGNNTSLMKSSFFIENIISISISIVVSYFIFERIRSAIISLINKTVTTPIIFSSEYREIKIMMLVFLLSIFISLVINYFSLNRYYKLSYYEKEALEYEEKVLEENSQEILENTEDEIEKLKNMIKNDEEDLEEFREGE